MAILQIHFKISNGNSTKIVQIHCYFFLKKCENPFLARLYESTGRAIAVTPASAFVSALASALLKMLKFLVKVFIWLYLLNMLMD